MKIITLPARGRITDIDKIVKDLDRLGRKFKVMIQLFNYDLIFSKLHVVSAVEHAVRSFQQNQNATSTLSLEVLLYIAGERQIHKAIKKVGITDKINDSIIVIAGDIKDISGYDGKLSNTLIDSVLATTQLTQMDTEFSGNQSTLKKFGISDVEINTTDPSHYEGLILEKIALVDIIK